MRIAIRLQNGRQVEAPIEEWVAALIALLPPQHQAMVCDRVEKKIIAHSTPGSHILYAEGGLIGVTRG